MRRRSREAELPEDKQGAAVAGEPLRGGERAGGERTIDELDKRDAPTVAPDRDEERKPYNVFVSEKIPHDARDTAHEHMPEGCWIEHHSEEVGEGQPARYGALLTERGAEAFANASNCEAIEEARLDEAFGEAEVSEGEAPAVPAPNVPDLEPVESQFAASSVQTHGVDREVLEFCKFFGAGGGVGKDVYVMVADTGYRHSRYLAGKIVERWTWFGDDGADRHGHGFWVSGAAVPQGAKLVSAKVLGDDGRGYNTFGIAALYRFARLCRDRGAFGVANFSLGGGSEVDRGYEEAGRFALANGVLPIAATGNNSWRDKISAPANGLSFLSVGAIDHRANEIADFSNRRPGHGPEIYAPGVRVGGQGGVMSGTSMATPIVTRGAVRAIGLPKVNANRARRLVIATGVRKNRYGGAGVLDVTRLIGRAKKV